MKLHIIPRSHRHFLAAAIDRDFKSESYLLLFSPPSSNLHLKSVIHIALNMLHVRMEEVIKIEDCFLCRKATN